MSALGKPSYGDFDSDGQIVAVAAERVIERTVIVTRTVSRNATRQGRSRAGAREASQPPMPDPLAPKPQPSDLSWTVRATIC